MTYLTAKFIDLLSSKTPAVAIASVFVVVTLARNARTSVEMIEKFYASTLSAEMNIALLHGKRN